MIDKKERTGRVAMELLLKKPTMQHKKDCELFIRECKVSGAELAGDGGLFTLVFEQWLKQVYDFEKGLNMPEGYVPSTKHLCYEGDVLVGIIDIRHRLTDFLYDAGGHVGYMIRPTLRAFGYGTRMLALGLDYAKHMLKLERVLITCNVANKASQKVIKANKGIYEDTRYNETLGTVKRFWINLYGSDMKGESL